MVPDPEIKMNEIPDSLSPILQLVVNSGAILSAEFKALKRLRQLHPFPKWIETWNFLGGLKWLQLFWTARSIWKERVLYNDECMKMTTVTKRLYHGIFVW